MKIPRNPVPTFTIFLTTFLLLTACAHQRNLSHTPDEVALANNAGPGILTPGQVNAAIGVISRQWQGSYLSYWIPDREPALKPEAFLDTMTDRYIHDARASAQQLRAYFLCYAPNVAGWGSDRFLSGDLDERILDHRPHPGLIKHRENMILAGVRCLDHAKMTVCRECDRQQYLQVGLIAGALALAREDSRVRQGAIADMYKTCEKRCEAK